MESGYWFTTENGTHVHADSGQSKISAMNEQFGKNTSNFSPSIKVGGKKGQMIQRIGEQTGVDLSNVLEKRTAGSRKYLGVQLSNLSKRDENNVRQFLASKKISVESNGGYGDAIWL